MSDQLISVSKVDFSRYTCVQMHIWSPHPWTLISLDSYSSNHLFSCVVFFRGEVIAKADHTEQILYSDIGKLLWTVLPSWPACDNDCSQHYNDTIVLTRLLHSFALGFVIKKVTSCRMIIIFVQQFGRLSIYHHPFIIIFFSFLDLSYLDNVRAQIPVQQQKRSDVYKLEMIS